MAAGVPTVRLGLRDHLRTHGLSLSSLNRTVIGGSAASEAMIREFEEVYRVRVLHAWRMTETGPVDAVNQFKPVHHDTLDSDARCRLQTR